MNRLLNRSRRLGDRLLTAVVPRTTASACVYYRNACYLARQSCPTGATCIEWYQCHTDVDGVYCHVDPPGGYDYNVHGCC